MSEPRPVYGRISEQKLAAIVVQANAAPPGIGHRVDPQVALDLVAEIRRLRAIILEADTVRPAEAVTVPALADEAAAIRAETENQPV